MGKGSIFAGSLGGLMELPEGMSYDASRRAEKSRMAALNLRMRQVEDSSRQQSIDQMQHLNHTLASQAAIQAARGGGTAGPVSANMISIADINEFAQDQNADKLNEVFQKEAIESQMASSSSQALGQQVGIITSGVMDAAKTAANAYVPNTTPTPPVSTVPRATSTREQNEPNAFEMDRALGINIPEIPDA